MFVHGEGNGIVVALDHDIAGCIDFKDAFGDQKTDVVLLLNKVWPVLEFYLLYFNFKNQ